MSGLANYLDKVRARPEPERRRLLWIWTVSLTFIIVLVWLLNLYVTGAWNFAGVEGGEVGEVLPPEGGSAWSNIWGSIKEGWGVVTGKFFHN